MPLDTAACFRILEELERNDSVKKNLQNSAKNALVVGSSALVGSVLGGPAGFVAGATFGTGVAWKVSEDYVSIITAIRSLTPEQRARMTEEMNRIVNALSYSDVMVLNSFLASGAAMSGLSSLARQTLQSGIQNFLSTNTNCR